MPTSPPRPCKQPGCPALVARGEGGGYCPQHRVRDDRGSSTDQGYGVRWRRARAAWLAAHPLCAECEREGRVTPASVVDHIIPHRGDYGLFWDGDNWQSLCRDHHQTKTNKERASTVW